MYTNTVKRLLYRQCVTILTGADCCAESVLAMRDQILPDEIDNDGDAAPSLPPLTVPDSDDDERSIEVDAFLEGHQDVESIPEVPTIIPASMASTIIFDGPPVEEEGELVAARRTGTKQLEAWEQREIKRRAPPPEPVTSLVGARESLSFGPALPEGRKTLLPRQPRGRFDAAARSKLLDQFMEKPRLGRSQNVDRTEPVPWCKTGGVVTHVAAPRPAHPLLQRAGRQISK